MPLPDGCFDFIWFDCCYMSCIELAYQLRHKTRYFVAYPTEVYSPGLDYSAAIPELLKPVADLPAAAKTIYDYYTYRVSYAPAAVTIGVFDLSVIEEGGRCCTSGIFRIRKAGDFRFTAIYENRGFACIRF